MADDLLPPPEKAAPIPDQEAIQSPGVSYTPDGRLNITVTPGKTGNVPSAGQGGEAITPPMSGEVHDAIAKNGSYSAILNAFGQGFSDEWGAAQFGPDLKKAMTDAGILYGGKGEPTVGQAFNEAFLRPAANALDVGLRTITGLGQGIHDAAIEAGHPFDALAAGMEAFPMGGAELGRLGWFPGKLAKPVEGAPDLRQAADLGVIGPSVEKSPIADGTPAQAAFAATATIEDRMNQPQSLSGAVTPYEEKMLAPAGSPFDNSDWQARFDQYIGKLQTSDDAKNLIQNSVELNNTYAEARAGEIPPAHLQALSEATGIPVDQMNLGQLRTKLDNDLKFRAATQMMLKLNDAVYDAARAHRASGGFETRKALIEAIIRHDAAVEYVMGLRAEWGRTGNVMQEFLDRSKDAQGLGKFIGEKRGEGWNSAKLDEIADQLGGLNSREAVGRYLNDLHKPDFLDKAIYYWTNSLLSGLLTHAKYVFANSAYIAYDTLIATPMAGLSGLARQDADRVYMGEAFAKAYGLVAGVPDALYAAGQAVKTGIPTSLKAQVKGAGNTNPVTGLKPIGGTFGTVVGVPSNVIAGIHSFFNFLGYRAELEALAYRKVAKSGVSPLTQDFWKQQKAHVQFPDDPMMDGAIEAGARANFVQDLGAFGKATQGYLYRTKFGRFVMPFIKVPGNIANAIQEGSPLAWLDERTRADLKAGGAKRDMAIGRMVAGSAIMGWASYMTLQDRITGNGPIDPKQRAEWMLTHQPHSINVNGRWYSYDRFGPVGGWLALASDITDATHDIIRAQADGRLTEKQAKQFDQDLMEGTSRAVTGLTNYIEEAGAQGLFDLVQTMTDPNKSKASGFGRAAGSWLPFSSAQSQIASFMDPNVREQKSFIDGVRNMIPVTREGLPPLRDWSGAPRPNPSYHDMLKERDVNTDTVDREMQRLDIKPSLPPNNLKGVRLSDTQYDEYLTYAGTVAHAALHQMIDQPSWHQMGDFAKTLVIERIIKASRRQADAKMLLSYPALINEGSDNRLQDIMGQKHKPTAFDRGP